MSTRTVSSLANFRDNLAGMPLTLEQSQTLIAAAHEHAYGTGAFFESVGRLMRLPLIPADGSVMIRDGDAVLGAVGVSGAKPEEDRECAEAGVRVVLG
jgi:uncharacterized protein GlcG (DUF336 family)